MGVILGLIAGYFGGLVDNIIMRVVDIMLALPSLLLALVLTLLLTGCQEQGQGLTLRISLPQELTTLDPAMVTTDSEKIVVSHLYENLMNDFPKKSQLYYEMADIYLQNGDYEKALLTAEEIENELKD